MVGGKERKLVVTKLRKDGERKKEKQLHIKDKWNMYISFSWEAETLEKMIIGKRKWLFKKKKKVDCKDFMSELQFNYRNFIE